MRRRCNRLSVTETETLGGREAALLLVGLSTCPLYSMGGLLSIRKKQLRKLSCFCFWGYLSAIHPASRLYHSASSRVNASVLSASLLLATAAISPWHTSAATLDQAYQGCPSSQEPSAFLPQRSGSSGASQLMVIGSGQARTSPDASACTGALLCTCSPTSLRPLSLASISGAASRAGVASDTVYQDMRRVYHRGTPYTHASHTIFLPSVVKVYHGQNGGSPFESPRTLAPPQILYHKHQKKCTITMPNSRPPVLFRIPMRPLCALLWRFPAVFTPSPLGISLPPAQKRIKNDPR